MKWSITVKKWATITLWSGIAGAASFLATHVGETGCPAWAQPLAQCVLTGIIVAAGNARKHWKD